MTTDFAERRLKMVDGQLRTTDVNDNAIVDAVMSVPREDFVPAARAELAYIDEDIQVAPAGANGSARYLMEPSPFAKLLQLAEISGRDRVLDVGSTTGYSAAVLARLASSVVALESDADLAARARATLVQHGFGTVEVVEGPLPQGHAAGAPYDVIVIEGAVDEVPQSLLDQLAEGGRLVAVVGRGLSGIAQVFLKSAGTVTGRRAFNAAIRPLPGFERAATFRF